MGDWRSAQGASLVRLAAWERGISATADHAVDGLRRYKYLFLFLFSSLYFLATCFRASRKLFWFDELFTLYISRLPDMASVWSALKHGADLNPPLFYELVRLSESVFGEGPIGTRLPAILGFWICCLCLFRFVSTRTSVIAGLISMLFPLVTTAYFYAYEARPHGIVLAFGGIALICWQGTIHSKQRRWWLVGLFASLLCAMLNHTYAILLLVPLGLAELARSVILRRVDWIVWLSMVSSLSAVLLYLPLLRSAKTGLSGISQPSMSVLANSYQFHLGPAAGVLSVALALCFFFKFAWRNPQLLPPVAPIGAQSLDVPEVVALMAFVAMPFFSFLVAKVMGIPLYNRYSISTVIGFGCLFGIVTAKKPLVGLGVLFFLCVQAAINLYQYAKGDSIDEPSISLVLSTRANEFAQMYRVMESVPKKDLPIVLLGGDHEFLPIMHYAPSYIASRLVYVMRPGSDSNGEGCIALRQLCGFPGRCERMADFLAAHDTFLARGNSYSSDRIGYFIRAGADVKMESMSEDSFLVSIAFKKTLGAPAAALH